MKEHPILFSTPMVRAILEGRKTQTRRVIQPQPEIIIRPIDDKCNEVIWSDSKRVLSIGGGGDVLGACVRELCPYGYRGDRLWVRETFAYCPGDVYVYRSDYLYDVDSESAMTINMKTGETMPLRWRPSIHMPRKASRLTLEIVNVRVERLQEISEEDAISEGFRNLATDTARGDFSYLWDHINAKRGFGWDVNPWVWVIEFKRAA